jgi:hypothetical protein
MGNVARFSWRDNSICPQVHSKHVVKHFVHKLGKTDSTGIIWANYILAQNRQFSVRGSVLTLGRRR